MEHRTLPPPPFALDGVSGPAGQFVVDGPDEWVHVIVREPSTVLPLANQLPCECLAMTEYALALGKQISAPISALLVEVDGMVDTKNDDAVEARERAADMKTLFVAHNLLSRLVSPALPKSIRYLIYEADRAGPWAFLGAVPMVRRFTVIAVLLIILFVVMATSHFVDAGSKRIFDLEGTEALVKMMFWLSSAGLGCVFANLRQANHFIRSHTYLPSSESTYWIRFAMGLIAGLFIAVMMPLSQSNVSDGVTRPLLAFLGDSRWRPFIES